MIIKQDIRPNKGKPWSEARILAQQNRKKNDSN
jgi:hypothetical protein